MQTPTSACQHRYIQIRYNTMGDGTFVERWEKVCVSCSAVIETGSISDPRIPTFVSTPVLVGPPRKEPLCAYAGGRIVIGKEEFVLPLCSDATYEQQEKVRDEAKALLRARFIRTTREWPTCRDVPVELLFNGHWNSKTGLGYIVGWLFCKFCTEKP